MEARAIAKYVKVSPTKVGVVLDLIGRKNVQGAFAILQYTPRDATIVINRVLKSVVANAENNREMDAERLYVAGTFADADPVLRRFRSMGHEEVFRINRRTSNITLVVRERA